MEPTELQALPADATIICSRSSLGCEEEPWEQCIPNRIGSVAHYTNADLDDMLLEGTKGKSLAMMQNDLEMTLEALNKSLADTPKIDLETKEKLQALIAEIQLSLASAAPVDDSIPEHETLKQRMDKMIADFEVHHPQLTSNLSLIAERLADMGI